MFAMHLNILLITWLTIGGVHTGIDASNISDICECSPECTNSIEDCISGRFVMRDDCKCCKVCVKQEGESCHKIQSPCDIKAKLTCSSKGICQAIQRCEVDFDCPDDLACIKTACIDPCPLAEHSCPDVLRDSVCITKNHRFQCSCPAGSSPSGTKCTPDTKKIFFPRALESKTDKLLNKALSKPGFLLIKATTQNSTVVIVPSLDGGILHYKDSRSDVDAFKTTVTKGKNEVLLTGLSPSTKYTLKWVGSDGSSAKSETKTDDGCVHNDISYPVGAKWQQGCEETFSCHIGGKSEHRPRCIFVAGSIQKEGCIEEPSSFDPECCVQYNCNKEENSVLEKSSLSKEGIGKRIVAEPKLIVTSRTHNSVTVAWDDFRADDPSSSYVTEYREKVSDVSINIPWMKRETPRGQPPPTMTIANLKPDTNYEVRVGIYSNVNDRKLTAATQKIEVKTEPGCVYGNTSFPVGEFFQGCDERCSCALDSSVKCAERCIIPYFRKNSFSNDPFCTEEAVDDDDCCALVMCAHGDGLSGGEGEYDQCANIVCGKNAVCVSWPTLSEASSGFQDTTQPGSCRCMSGFSGNPTDLDIGCISDPEVKHEASSCQFHSKLYSPGEVFFDGCSYRCTCSNNLETYCQPRCKYSTSDIKDPTCDYQTNPEDECCLIRTCTNSTVNIDIVAMETPPLTFEGCIYKNKTYSKDEHFSDGCESKCSCMGFGDVSCFPRCPPTKDITQTDGLKCETLLDPQDKCCNVTICDTIVPEVMKTGISDNLLMVDDDLKIVENTTMLISGGKTLEAERFEPTTTDMHLVNKTDVLMSEDLITLETHNDRNETPEMSPVPLKRFRFEDPHSSSSLEITEITAVDSSNVKFKVRVNQDVISKILSSPGEHLTVSYSKDSLSWLSQVVFVDKIDILDMFYLVFTIPDIEEYENYDFKVTYEDSSSPVKKLSMLTAKSASIIGAPIILDEMCDYNGKKYKIGETFYEDCEQFCECTEDLTVFCSAIRCPRDFGLEIVDPDCIEWEDDSQYVALPPMCCGFKPKCSLHLNDLSCSHGGKNFSHLEYIPKEMVGCEQRCQCMNSRLDCYDLCDAIAATPPFRLQCTPPLQFITIVTKTTFPCCKEWQCVDTPGSELPHSLIPGFQHIFPQQPRPPLGISIPLIENFTDNSVTFTFTVPDLFLGLPAGLYLRYTDDLMSDQNHWMTEIIHVDGVILERINWRYVKTGLHPDTNYSMQLSLTSQYKKEDILSPIFFVTTDPDESQIQIIDVSRTLSIKDVTSTSAIVSWRLFTLDEIQFMHGIQVRYWSENIEIPKKSPLQHVDTDYMMIRDLLPNTTYTVDLVIVPKPEFNIEITFHDNITFTTEVSKLGLHTEKPEQILRKLDLDAQLTISDIEMTSAEISWRQFTERELKYIDGVGVRFWSNKKRFPEVGPMLHNDAGRMILKSLTPDTKYTVDLFFLAHSGISTTVSNTRNATFTTLPKMKDKYDFNITIKKGDIDAKGVQIMYSGVPQPEGNYIHVFRAVYTTDEDDQDSQKFKVPKNQENGIILLTNLRAKINYEVWLEAFIKDGTKKKSNVINVTSYYENSDSDDVNKIAKSKELKQNVAGNYYSAFVAVAILVAIACLIIVGLLFVLMRRTNHAKGRINSANKATAAYNNPSYKSSENPNYAMEMNGMKSTSTNGSSSLASEEP